MKNPMLLLLLFLCIPGCSTTPGRGKARVARSSCEIAVGIFWAGPQTKTMYEVAFVTKKQEKLLKELPAKSDWFYRSAIISGREACGLQEVLNTSNFNDLRRKRQPGWSFQGYVVVCRSGRTRWFYEIGFAQSTVQRLREIRNVLEAPGAGMMDEVIGCLPARWEPSSN